MPAADEDGVVNPEAAESPLRIADEAGRYQVLLSDGSLAYLEDLVQEDLEALAAACYELAIQSRGGELGRTIGVDWAAGLKDRFIVQRERLTTTGKRTPTVIRSTWIALRLLSCCRLGRSGRRCSNG